MTELVRAGVAPKDAKELARHSTITLTMDHYSHVTVRDTAAAVARLPMPLRPARQSAALKATGTDGWSNKGAAPGAAGIGEKGERLRVIEETASTEVAKRGSSKPAVVQSVEDDREESVTDEESMPDRS